MWFIKERETHTESLNQKFNSIAKKIVFVLKSREMHRLHFATCFFSVFLLMMEIRKFHNGGKTNVSNKFISGNSTSVSGGEE